MFIDCTGGDNIKDLDTFEYTLYDDVYDFMQLFYPDLDKALDAANATQFFDYNEFVEDGGDAEIRSDGKVVTWSI
jgi:hypothetical protein